MLVLGELLRRNASVVPDKAAFVYRSQAARVAVTYRELNAVANSFANALHAAGVEKGDRVAFLSRNNPELAMAMWGAVKAGAIAMPLNFRYTASELAPLLASGRPSLVVAETDYVESLLGDSCRPHLSAERILTFGSGSTSPFGSFHEFWRAGAPDEPTVDIAETDPHILLCTSGTTGPAKGVLQSHRAYYLQTGNPVLSERGTGEADIGLCPYQLFHSSGWRTSLIYWRARATVVILHRPSADDVIDAVETERITQVMALPQTLLEICETSLGGRDLSSVSAVNTGTSSITAEEAQRIRRSFPAADYRVHYGASEAGPVTTLRGEDTVTRPDSVGRPTIHVDVGILDPAGQPMPAGARGEIAVRSDFLMLGYRSDPESTSKVLVDGWYRTGDLGYLDEDGFLYVIGRVRDVIRSAGESIYPREVEACLLAHPSVSQVAVAGVRDPRWGQSVGAVVVRAEGVGDPDEELAERLRSHAAEHLAAYKVPRRFVFVTELPRVEATGKVAKQQLVGLLESPVTSRA